MKKIIITLGLITSLSSFADTWTCAADCAYKVELIGSGIRAVRAIYAPVSATANSPAIAFNNLINKCRDLGIEGINKNANDKKHARLGDAFTEPRLIQDYTRPYRDQVDFVSAKMADVCIKH